MKIPLHVCVHVHVLGLADLARIQPDRLQFFKLSVFPKLTNTEPFAAWLVVTGDATPDVIRVVRSLLGAISFLPIVVLLQ